MENELAASQKILLAAMTARERNDSIITENQKRIKRLTESLKALSGDKHD